MFWYVCPSLPLLCLAVGSMWSGCSGGRPHRSMQVAWTEPHKVPIRHALRRSLPSACLAIGSMWSGWPGGRPHRSMARLHGRNLIKCLSAVETLRTPPFPSSNMGHFLRGGGGGSSMKKAMVVAQWGCLVCAEPCVGMEAGLFSNFVGPPQFFLQVFF